VSWGGHPMYINNTTSTTHNTFLICENNFHTFSFFMFESIDGNFENFLTVNV
jgi:hypothetical protein